VQYNFEWDLKKARSNFQKHKISFERASEIFLDPFMLSVFDKVHSEIIPVQNNFIKENLF